MSQQTIEKLIPTEYLTSASESFKSFGDKMSESVYDLFGQTKDKICEKAGVVCFNKKKLFGAVIILVIIVLILSAVVAYLAYDMGHQYIEINRQVPRRNVEPYVDYEGRGINY